MGAPISSAFSLFCVICMKERTGFGCPFAHPHVLMRKYLEEF
jgi:hypothetical protein